MIRTAQRVVEGGPAGVRICCDGNGGCHGELKYGAPGELKIKTLYLCVFEVLIDDLQSFVVASATRLLK